VAVDDEADMRITSSDLAPGGLGGGDDARPQRADAVKNRRRLLDAAEEVFATQGAQAQVDLVAERAGLGVGTLYRHFPTKESLIEAIIRTRLEGLRDKAVAFADADQPGEAFFGFLHEFAVQAASKRDLFEALGAAGIDIKAECAEAYDELRRGIDHLLRRAQATGAVRADVTTDDVIGLVAGTCQSAAQAGRDPGCTGRMITIVCDGLRGS
jgi:AcrR family transcriptional regulator